MKWVSYWSIYTRNIILQVLSVLQIYSISTHKVRLRRRENLCIPWDIYIIIKAIIWPVNVWFSLVIGRAETWSIWIYADKLQKENISYIEFFFRLLPLWLRPISKNVLKPSLRPKSSKYQYFREKGSNVISSTNWFFAIRDRQHVFPLKMKLHSLVILLLFSGCARTF